MIRSAKASVCWVMLCFTIPSFLVILLHFLQGCYDPRSPNLPPCDGKPWPDPCYARTDGGNDAR